MRPNFGRQPFVDIIKERGHSYAWVMRQTGLHYTHFVNVANGRTPPAQEFRERLSAFLKLPQKKLFTPEALAATYVRTQRTHVLARRGDWT